MMESRRHTNESTARTARAPARIGGVLCAALVAALLLVGCREDSTTPGRATRTAPPATPTRALTPSVTVPPASSTGSALISKEKAANVVTTKYGGQVIHVEPGTTNGQPVWKVEAQNTSEGHIEADVSQVTGDILQVAHG
jgi:uncharacterized membrane protein YkoI